MAVVQKWTKTRNCENEHCNKKPIKNATQTQFRINICRHSVTNRGLYKIEQYNFNSAV